MASDSSNRLTRFVSTTTIITSDVANMWYGGLYGSSDASLYASDHPIVSGHVHDGKHADGHAQKVNLVDHVTSQLKHDNLAGDAIVPYSETRAVRKRNVRAYDLASISQAIPHWEEHDGTKYYYIDLSMSDLGAFKEVENPAGDYSEEDHIRTTDNDFDSTGWDFLFGSDSLEFDPSEPSKGTHRIQFDRSLGSFRAGIATGDHWDESKRGMATVVFGEDNLAQGDHSGALSGLNNHSSSQFSTISGGTNNSALGENSNISGGAGNIIEDESSNSSISGGTGNIVGNISSFGDKGSCFASVISGGDRNKIGYLVASGVISGGRENFIGAFGQGQIIAGGCENSIGSETDWNAILGGLSNTIGDGGTSYNVIGAGHSNGIPARGLYNSIFGGYGNTIDTSWDNGAIGVDSNVIAGGHSNILGGQYPHGLTTIHGVTPKPGFGAAYSCGVLSGTHNHVDGWYSAIASGAGSRITKKAYAKVFESRKEPNAFEVISGGGTNFIESEYNRNLGYNTIAGGGANYIKNSYGSTISGGMGGDIKDFTLVWDKEIVGVTGQNSHLIGSMNTIIGGRGNLIEGYVKSYAIPGDPTGSAGLMFGSAPMNSVAHGIHAHAHMYNQIAHGGGQFVDGYGPKGQRQTSVIVVSTEISHGPHGSPADPTDGAALVMIDHTSQRLTPVGRAFVTADPEFIEDGTASNGTNFFGRAILIPINTTVTAKLTWVATWTHPSFSNPRSVTGEIWGLFRMQDDPGGVVEVIADGQNYMDGSPGMFICSHGWEPFEPIAGVGYGIITPRVQLDFKTPGGNWGVHDYKLYPIRVVGRLEWTQVWQEPLDG